jgi:hypothetical protein
VSEIKAVCTKGKGIMDHRMNDDELEGFHSFGEFANRPIQRGIICKNDL